MNLYNKKGRVNSPDLNTRDELTIIAKVGNQTISRVEKILKYASQSQIEKLNSGESSINEIYNQIRKKKKALETKDQLPILNDLNDISTLSELPDNSIDLIATDPPYGIGKLNGSWDHSLRHE